MQRVHDVCVKKHVYVNLLSQRSIAQISVFLVLKIVSMAALAGGPRLVVRVPVTMSAVRANGTVREADPPLPASVNTCEPVIKGDAKIFCIAAASIIAKVTRDRIMEDLDKQYPGYGLAQHAGYPTRDHVAAIHRMGGVCPEHRMTFKPIRGSAWRVLPQFFPKKKSSKKNQKNQKN